MKAVVLMLIVMVQMLYFTSAQIPTSTEMPPITAPQMSNFGSTKCISTQLKDCANNINTTKLVESMMNNPNDIQYPCCSEWDEEIKSNTKCVCDYAGSYVSYLDDYFKGCKLNTTPEALCQDTSKTGNGGGSASNDKASGANEIARSLLPILLLIFSVFMVKF